jgi:hypothetical protein
MFDITDQLPDRADDLIGGKLARIQELDRWTGEKHRLVLELNELLPRYGYVAFWAHAHRYHLHRVGQSCRYQVPPRRRGKLEPFRGQTVRIACVASGKYQVLLMAGAIGSAAKPRPKAQGGAERPKTGEYRYRRR